MNATATLDNQPRNDSSITIIYHRQSGDVVKKISRQATARIASLAIIGAMALIGVMVTSDPEVKAWEARREAAALRPTMERLADEGKERAAMWMVYHYPDKSEKYLAALVADKYADALFYRGVLEYNNGKNAPNQTSLQMIRQAANQGYMPAIKLLAKKDADTAARFGN